MEEEQAGGDAVSIKRRCITLSTDISHDMNNMFEINHNDEQAYDLNNFNDNNNSNTPNRNSLHVHNQQTSQPQPPVQPAMPRYITSQLTNVFVQQTQLTCTVISHNQQPSPQGDMIMDLNDETYSNSQIDICSPPEPSHSAMDSDYVPTLSSISSTSQLTHLVAGMVALPITTVQTVQSRVTVARTGTIRTSGHTYRTTTRISHTVLNLSKNAHRSSQMHLATYQKSF